MSLGAVALAGDFHGQVMAPPPSLRRSVEDRHLLTVCVEGSNPSGGAALRSRLDDMEALQPFLDKYQPGAKVKPGATDRLERWMAELVEPGIREILAMHMGLYDGRIWTEQEIADEGGVEVDVIHWAINEGMRQLGKPTAGYLWKARQ